MGEEITKDAVNIKRAYKNYGDIERTMWCAVGML